MRYAPLHNHTIYSVKDAISTPREYVDGIFEYNESQNKHEIVALAVTEHSNLYSITDHHLACTVPKKGDELKRTLKPIYGNEIYHLDLEEDNKDYKKRFHLVLLAKTQEGLKNLMNISSDAGLRSIKTSNKTYHTVMTRDLKKYGKGIIALSACLGGRIGYYIKNNNYTEAKKTAIYFNNCFEEFYLELQPHDIPEQKLLNNALMQIHRETGIPIVVTSDSHYVNKEDREYHDVIKITDAITMNMKDERALVFNTANHLWTPDELIDWCNSNNIPLECIENTAKIADSINCTIDMGDPKGLFPEFPVPKGYTEDTYLIKLVEEGLYRRFTTNTRIKNFNNYISRINYELDVITQMGYSGYFLVLNDWLTWCKKKEIPINVGRGSGAGSLVCYCLSITGADPIEHNLLFERFLNPERKDEPDVDTDVSKTHRAECLEYLKQRYGEEHVCQIATFSRYGVKNTIRTLMSASRGFTKEEQDAATKIIPSKIGEEYVSYSVMLDVINNTEKYEQDPEVKGKEIEEIFAAYNVLKELFKKHPEIEKALLKLKGAVSSVGCHAGGVVITSKKLTDYVPIMKTHGVAVLNVSQLDMDGIHFFRALKLDVLGLKAISQIGLCLKLAKLPFSWLDDESCEDKLVYDFLVKGNTNNVFQMANKKPTSMISENKVCCLKGLTDINALNRPGCLAIDANGSSIYIRYFESNKSGNTKSYHKDIDNILKETNGEILYQEQIMQIGMKLAGYTLGMSDIRLRKTVAKKIVKLIPEIRNEFIYGKKSLYDEDGNVIGKSEEDSPNCEGCIKRGYSEVLGVTIFNMIEDLAKYSFNLSHSLAYSITSYRTAYLSYYYPVEWAVACLSLDSSDGNAKDKKIATFNNCKKREIKILQPSINTSESGFSVDMYEGKKAVRFGLLGVQDVGVKPIKAINLLRNESKFTSFNDFITRANEPDSILTKEPDFRDVNGAFINPLKKGNIVALILSGAFDEFEENRYKVYNEYVHYRRFLAKTKDKTMEEKDEKEFRMRERLEHELHYLNFYVSKHPLDGECFSYQDISICEENAKVNFSGILKKFEQKRSSTDKIFYNAYLELKDGTTAKVQIWKDQLAKFGFTTGTFTSDRAKAGKEIFNVEGIYSKEWGNVKPFVLKRYISPIDTDKLEKIGGMETSEGITSLEDMLKNNQEEEDMFDFSLD